MADSTVLREFVISLGWDVGKPGEEKFVKTVNSATKQVLALGAATVAAATTVAIFVTKISQSLESLYYTSQRTGASVKGIQSFGFAIGQLGGTADGARQSLENLGSFLRSSPGSESFIRNLGVETRTANGELRDTSEIMLDLGKRFRAMPFYQAKSFAQVLGIDENTLIAMERGAGQFSKQYRDLLSAANFDSDKAAKSSAVFMNSVRTLGAAISIMAQKVGADIATRAQPHLDRFISWFTKNFPIIEKWTTSTIAAIARFIAYLGQLAGRGLDALRSIGKWFDSLDESTQNVIKAVAALALAWYALNSTFLATPLGRVIALGAAILALYDDYKTWQDGGKSFINWEEWKPQIQGAIEAINALKEAAKALWDYVEPKLSALADYLGFDDLKKWADTQISETKDVANIITHFARGDIAGGLDVIHARVERNTNPNGLARNVRNNNPGNIEYGPWAVAHGATGSDRRFAKFDTPEAGLAAQSALLAGYGQQGMDTISKVINKWAPAKDNNNTGAYIAQVAAGLGIDPNAHIDLQDPALRAALAQQMANHEGRNPYTGEQFERAAGISGASVVISQQTDIHLNGGGGSQADASAVASKQKEVNAQLLRNTQGSIDRPTPRGN